MTKDVLAISTNDVEVEKLFNQNRNIIHYYRNCFHAITIATIMMFCMHTNKNSSMTLNNEKNEKIKQSKIYMNEDISTSSKLNENFFENDDAIFFNKIAIEKKEK